MLRIVFAFCTRTWRSPCSARSSRATRSATQCAASAWCSISSIRSGVKREAIARIEELVRPYSFYRAMSHRAILAETCAYDNREHAAWGEPLHAREIGRQLLGPLREGAAALRRGELTVRRRRLQRGGGARHHARPQFLRRFPSRRSCSRWSKGASATICLLEKSGPHFLMRPRSLSIFPAPGQPSSRCALYLRVTRSSTGWCSCSRRRARSRPRSSPCARRCATTPSRAWCSRNRWCANRG